MQSKYYSRSVATKIGIPRRPSQDESPSTFIDARLPSRKALFDISSGAMRKGTDCPQPAQHPKTEGGCRARTAKNTGQAFTELVYSNTAKPSIAGSLSYTLPYLTREQNDFNLYLDALGIMHSTSRFTCCRAIYREELSWPHPYGAFTASMRT